MTETNNSMIVGNLYKIKANQLFFLRSIEEFPQFKKGVFRSKETIWVTPPRQYTHFPSEDSTVITVLLLDNEPHANTSAYCPDNNTIHVLDASKKYMKVLWNKQICFALKHNLCAA